MKGYDLAERTSRFGESVIEFSYKLQFDAVTDPIIRQLVRSATSVGANYCEADDAESKKDFRHKICTCRKEAKETKYWLRMIAKADSTNKLAARVLWKEAHQLHRIFCAIVRTTDKNLKNTQA
jgi:four helix bundle protein